MSTASEKFRSSHARFFACVLLIAASSLAACGKDSAGNAEPSSPGGTIPLTPTDLEYHSATPAEFQVSQGRFVVPAGLNARWPVDQDPRDISSTFGPRLKASEASRPDFHRGIDIRGQLGQPVYPILPGKIYKVVAGGESSEGGNVVTIEHVLPEPIVFHGKNTTRIYSQYAHLADFGEKANKRLLNPEMEIEISPDEIVGGLGQSGTTTFNHLHFEIRLETTCSLEYQTENPDILCAQNGFDPHVNPLQFLLENDGEGPRLDSVQRVGDELKVRVSTDALWADLDYTVLKVLDESQQTIRQFRIGFNAREGFDASSTEKLDDPQLEGVLLSPSPFLSDSAAYSMEYSFELASLPRAPATVHLLSEDVWGNGFSTQLQMGN